MDDSAIANVNRGVLGFGIRSLEQKPNQRNAKVNTAASSGIESEACFSHDGKLVAYAFAYATDSKSARMVDGNNPHVITGADQDALHPVFSPDDSKVFYAASSFTGRHSPVVRPARHDWDVFSIPVQSNVVTACGAIETRHTRRTVQPT